MNSSVKVIVLSVILSSALGFMFDDPCDVFPQYSGGIPDSDAFTTNVNVPASCKNGTFRWDYPRGHALLQFHNTQAMTIELCIKDSLGGDIFTITDTASGQRLGHFDYNTWACFPTTSARDIVLKVDAPESLRYMGAFEYKNCCLTLMAVPEQERRLLVPTLGSKGADKGTR